MSKAKRNLILLVLTLLIVVGLGARFAYAWLTFHEEKTFDSETSSLAIYYKIWFDQNGNSEYDESVDVDASMYYIGDEESEQSLKVIQMSSGNPAALNYIGKLRVQVRVETNSDYYIRVKFANEWFMTRRSLSTNAIRHVTINQSNRLMMPYGLNSNWYYDPVTTYTYYQYVVNQNVVIPVVNQTSLTEFADSTTVTFETKYFVYLDVQFEFVQANRMNAIWDLDEIPHAS